MRKAKALQAFPYAFNGIDVEHLKVGDVRDFNDGAFKGLEAAGYIEASRADELPEEEKLNRSILEAFDRKLAAASDEELKAIIARSGTPYAGNMVHARLVFAAKQQMLRELEGVAPVLGINPSAGVTEQPLAKPGEATPPSAAAAVEQQQNAAKATAADSDVKLEELTVAELKEHAEGKNIDLGEATKKADIIETIKKGGATK